MVGRHAVLSTATAANIQKSLPRLQKSSGSIWIFALRQQFVFVDELIRGGLKLGRDRAAVAQLQQPLEAEPCIQVGFQGLRV